ncbi:MAG: winged helix-turn-helix domain-containing protein [Ferruginibacter sp.]
MAAVIRRKSFDGKNKTQLGNLILDVQEKVLRVNSGKIDLTRIEYLLLEYFICNNKRVITREGIAEHLSGENNDMTDNYNFIYTQIKI